MHTFLFVEIYKFIYNCKGKELEWNKESIVYMYLTLILEEKGNSTEVVKLCQKRKCGL